MTTGSTTKAGRRSGGGWTAERMADQQGRTFVVTGATSGLGLVTARELAARGGRVLLAVRDAARGDEVASSLRRAYPGAEVEVRQVDLLNLRSIRRAAEEIGEEEAVDVLINNAGISMVEHSVTEQGAERHFAANHLGHFALTALLEPALRRSPAPRVVTRGPSTGPCRSSRRVWALPSAASKHRRRTGGDAKRLWSVSERGTCVRSAR
ncbi:short subunit dehydrogenase [Streptomyces sp. 3212.3]|nr:short subunit dehydrogenase [Streptomyces sp. 3212.3]